MMYMRTKPPPPDPITAPGGDNEWEVRPGLHHEDQKIMYKDKERNSKTFLDVVGVKDRSKMVLLEDPISHEKRYIEMRKNAIMEKAAKSISEIRLEVDEADEAHGFCCHIDGCRWIKTQMDDRSKDEADGGGFFSGSGSGGCGNSGERWW